jgi:hypothetical protein
VLIKKHADYDDKLKEVPPLPPPPNLQRARDALPQLAHKVKALHSI